MDPDSGWVLREQAVRAFSLAMAIQWTAGDGSRYTAGELMGLADSFGAYITGSPQ